MKIYLYGIIDSNDNLSNSINGLDGARVFNIPFRDIGIIVSNLNGEVQNITPDRAVVHEGVVEILMENFTVLPVRFLTVFDRKKDILAILHEYYSDFRQNLDRLQNKAEFGIKVIWPGDKIREQITASYAKEGHNMPEVTDLLRKSFIKEKFDKYKIDKEFQKEADGYITFVDNFFNKIAVEKKVEKLKTDILLLNASYLIEKEKQVEFRQAFEKLRKTKVDFKYLLSGPWPPYNFIILRQKHVSRNYGDTDMPEGIPLGESLTNRKII